MKIYKDAINFSRTSHESLTVSVRRHKLFCEAVMDIIYQNLLHGWVFPWRKHLLISTMEPFRRVYLQTTNTGQKKINVSLSVWVFKNRRLNLNSLFQFVAFNKVIQYLQFKILFYWTLNRSNKIYWWNICWLYYMVLSRLHFLRKIYTTMNFYHLQCHARSICILEVELFIYILYHQYHIKHIWGGLQRL